MATISIGTVWDWPTWGAFNYSANASYNKPTPSEMCQANVYSVLTGAQLSVYAYRDGADNVVNLQCIVTAPNDAQIINQTLEVPKNGGYITFYSPGLWYTGSYHLFGASAGNYTIQFTISRESSVMSTRHYKTTDATLTLSYTPRCRIVFNEPDLSGNTAISSGLYTKNATVVVPAYTPPAGYDFIGWQRVQTGQMYASNEIPASDGATDIYYNAVISQQV